MNEKLVIKIQEEINKIQKMYKACQISRVEKLKMMIQITDSLILDNTESFERFLSTIPPLSCDYDKSLAVVKHSERDISIRERLSFFL